MNQINESISPRYNENEAGISLIEIIAALSIIAAIVVGSLALFSAASSSQSSNQLVQDVLSVQTAVKQLWQGQGTYGTGSLNGVLISAKKLPSTIRVSGATLTHVLNGTVAVTGAGATFTIALDNIPQDICVSLLSSSTGWAQIQGTAGGPVTTFPISPVTAVSSCGAAPGTITYTSN
jgi:type II secretory pathway pseudopilin PulG